MNLSNWERNLGDAVLTALAIILLLIAVLLLDAGCGKGCEWDRECYTVDGGFPPCGWLWMDGDGGMHPTKPICRERVCIQECSP